MLELRSTRQNELFEKIFVLILSGTGLNPIQLRFMDNGKEVLQIRFEVHLDPVEIRCIRHAYPYLKDYLEDKFRSHEIGKTYPGIAEVKYIEISKGIRLMIEFEGTSIPE
jgi:hypothetical protein